MSASQVRHPASRTRVVGGLSAVIIENKNHRGAWYSIRFFRDDGADAEDPESVRDFELSELEPLQELIDWARGEIARLESANYRSTRPTKL